MDEFKIGDLISLDGRAFSVRGFDPMSLPEQRVELVEIETGVAIRVRLAQLQSFRVKRATAARALAASAAETETAAPHGIVSNSCESARNPVSKGSRPPAR